MIKINIPRRIGTSTRLADSYIQELFTKGKITVKDVYPKNRPLDEDLFNKIYKRLEFEHPRIKMDANKGDLTIEIKGVKD